MDGGRDAPKPTLRDVVKFKDDVKRTFRDETGKYDELIQIARDVVAHRVDEEVGKARVKEVLKGHPELLESFNFVCPGAAIAIPPEAEKSSEDASNLLKKIKARFQGHDSHVFKSFLDIMIAYRKENKSVKEVHTEVLKLLQGHQDLIEDVTSFFPRGMI